MRKRGHNYDNVLKTHVDALEELEIKLQEVKLAKKQRMKLVKDDGYEAPIVEKVLKERFRSQEQRDAELAEKQRKSALLTLYLTKVGYLDGTPLGDYERQELSKAIRKANKQPDPTPEEVEREEKETLQEAASLPKEETLEEARERGRAAGKAGKSCMANPYDAKDERRKQWDAGWYEVTGKNGFEIPEHLQKSKKEKKKKDPDQGAAGGADDETSSDSEDREAA